MLIGPIQLKLRTSNVKRRFPGTVQTWPLKIFSKRRSPQGHVTPNFGALNANNLITPKTVKATDFKCDTRFHRQSGHEPWQIFWKGAWPGSRDPNFWVLNANSSINSLAGDSSELWYSCFARWYKVQQDYQRSRSINLQGFPETPSRTSSHSDNRLITLVVVVVAVLAAETACTSVAPIMESIWTHQHHSAESITHHWYVSRLPVLTLVGILRFFGVPASQYTHCLRGSSQQ